MCQRWDRSGGGGAGCPHPDRRFLRHVALHQAVPHAQGSCCSLPPPFIAISPPSAPKLGPTLECSFYDPNRQCMNLVTLQLGRDVAGADGLPDETPFMAERRPGAWGIRLGPTHV